MTANGRPFLLPSPDVLHAKGEWLGLHPPRLRTDGLTQTSGQASCTDYIQVGAEVAPTALTCGPGFLTAYETEHT